MKQIHISVISAFLTLSIRSGADPGVIGYQDPPSTVTLGKPKRMLELSVILVLLKVCNLYLLMGGTHHAPYTLYTDHFVYNSPNCMLQTLQMHHFFIF